MKMGNGIAEDWYKFREESLIEIAINRCVRNQIRHIE